MFVGNSKAFKLIQEKLISKPLILSISIDRTTSKLFYLSCISI